MVLLSTICLLCWLTNFVMLSICIFISCYKRFNSFMESSKTTSGLRSTTLPRYFIVGNLANVQEQKDKGWECHCDKSFLSDRWKSGPRDTEIERTDDIYFLQKKVSLWLKQQCNAGCRNHFKVFFAKKILKNSCAAQQLLILNLKDVGIRFHCPNFKAFQMWIIKNRRRQN